MNKNNKFIIAIVTLLVIALIVVMCRDVSEIPEITPTLSISATPSDTPAPPTATSTTVAPVAVSPLPAQGTAVATSSSTTAVPNTSTPTATSGGTTLQEAPTFTATPTPTAPPTPTERPSSHTVEAGENLSFISRDYCGRQDWAWIFDANREEIKNPSIIFAGQVFTLPWPCRGE